MIEVFIGCSNHLSYFIWRNLPEAMSNMLEGRAMGMPYNIHIFRINMKEYEDMQLKVGEKVTIVIKKTDDSSTGI